RHPHRRRLVRAFALRHDARAESGPLRRRCRRRRAGRSHRQFLAQPILGISLERRGRDPADRQVRRRLGPDPSFSRDGSLSHRREAGVRRAHRVASGQTLHLGNVFLSVSAMDRFREGATPMIWQHMRGLWPRFTLAPAAPFWAWAVFWVLRGQLRWDHVAVAVLASALAYGNATSKKLYLGLLPFGVVGLFYDAMRFVRNVGLTESNVHLCDLREAELRWFGVYDGRVRVTLQDWFQARPTVLLD